MKHLDSESRKLIIIIPAYNEAKRITETITALLGIRQKFTRGKITVLSYVVDDGSEDETRRLAREGRHYRD